MKKHLAPHLYLFFILLLGLSYACEKEKENQNVPIWNVPVSHGLKSMYNWKIASTPLHQAGADMFPESAPGTGLGFRKNAARLAWYNIDPIFSFRAPLLPPNITPDELSNHFVRRVKKREIWMTTDNPSALPVDLLILDMAYYPTERGPYNYDAAPTSISMGMDSDGALINPASRWGGITSCIDDHIEQLPNRDNPHEWTIDFILMDPFVYDPDHSGGDMYIHLGLVSEDVLRDGRTSVESGLPASATITGVDTTIWGRVPTASPASAVFHSNPASRPFQDVGLDGLNNEDERLFFNDNFLSVIADLHGSTSKAYQLAYEDASADDFQHFRSSEFDVTHGSILERYRRFNGLDGNSSTGEQSNETYPISATNMPDREDFSDPGILQQTERYFQYKISLRPEDMVYNQNYITDINDARSIPLANFDMGEVNWYYFSIPIQCPNREIIGGTPSVEDYRFIRILYKNFEQTIVCRFAAFQFVVDDENRPVFEYTPYPLL